MVRGAGKFKQKRGGGRSFSKDMGFDDAERLRDDQRRETIDENSEEEEEEGEEEEESGEEEESEEEGPAQPELTRAQRRELKKKQGGKEKEKAEAAAAKAKERAQAKAEKNGDDEEEEESEEEDDDSDLINPNHVQKKMTISDLSKPRELTRREREQKEKQEAKDRYWKLHTQGKTEEAKNDLQRLAKIRAEREAAQAKRKAELEAKAQETKKQQIRK